MRLTGGAIAFAFAVTSAFATSASAQIFSPGGLSKAHASVDGLTQCVKCHTGDSGGHDDGKCLDCHQEIKSREEANRGYHARVAAEQCASCHLEHRGRDADIVQWKPSQKAFNHGLTGWPLQQSHKKRDCKECHQARAVTDAAVKKLAEESGRNTFLGVSTACTTCHHDEHRGQEGKDCARCHDSSDFSKAPSFNHNSKKFAEYPLTGQHAKVACADCHDSQSDSADLTSWPKPRAQEFLRFKDIPHAQCTACHDDFHRGAFGRDCIRCHTPDGWRLMKQNAGDTAFHDKHAFQLRGAHSTVSCRSCHGPFPGEAARFKGVKFKNCADCHFDAHIGQLTQATRCESCHTVNGFTPVLFGVEQHSATRFPLESSHQAVACDLCHRSDAKNQARLPSKIRAEVSRKNRKLLVSGARLSLSAVFEPKKALGETTDCGACHVDVHYNQFEKPTSPPSEAAPPRGCASCHSTTTFTDLKFNHDNSRFPLTGKHKAVECTSCHEPGSRGPQKGVVGYRHIGVECASCHADVHVGQMKTPEGSVDCSACHTTDGFKPGKFDHDTQSTFPLDGKHEKVACARCHPSVDAMGLKVSRYKPLPAECGACHDDQHKGTFDAFTPAAREKGRCDSCHTASAWAPAAFAHAGTGFPLTGRHEVVACVACHSNADYMRAVPQTCVGCHVDVHAQEFGNQCQTCHTTERFEGPRFAVDAHRRSSFPLAGRHATLPCDECHSEKRERTFWRAGIDCASCHAADAQRASLVTVDHARPPVAGVSCRSCHAPTTFAPAKFAQHDACFPITRGAHSPVLCAECHDATIIGSRIDGDCGGVGVRCADCHFHNAEAEAGRHANVVGYEHKSGKCVGCHRVLP